MPEITSEVAIARPGGLLANDAVGWSRRPLQTSHELPHGVYYGWRTKKWEYWGIVSPDIVLGLTLVDLDYASALQIYLHDRKTGETVEYEPNQVLAGRKLSLPTGLPPFTATGEIGDTSISCKDEDNSSTIIKFASPRASGELRVDARGESLNVLVPWSDTRFQYTQKAPALPVTGWVSIDGRKIEVGDDAWAVRDRGRGRWPYMNKWNWAAGSGVNPDGVRVGLSVGAGWTDGTGTTENSLVVDGVLDACREEIKWTYDVADPEKPWVLKADWIEATITPFHVRNAATNMIAVASATIQVFGAWSGWATLSDGRRISLDGLTGWAEEANQRF